MDNKGSLETKGWDLPLRLIAAAFLCSVGIGYGSALVNLHFQEASPGKPLPGPEDVVRVYHGSEKSNQLLRLLEAPESLPFNGSGSMRGAFTRRKNPGAIKTGAAEVTSQLKDAGFEVASGEFKSKMETFAATWLEIERQSLIAWIGAGFPESAYTEDAFTAPPALADKFLDLRKSFVKEVASLKSTGKVAPDKAIDPNEICFCDTLQMADGKLTSRIKTIIDERCARCHGTGKSVAAYPLSRFEHVKVYLDEDLGAAHGKSLAKLALSTHVHLLGFAVLYGLTGLIFALLPYPAWLRLILAPAPLILQVVDISFWWLARLDAPLGPLFAQGIMATGGLVAMSLAGQIVLGLWGLFPGKARYLVLAALAFAGATGLCAKLAIIDPYLAQEAAESGDSEK
jgi:hypothetical protein